MKILTTHKDNQIAFPFIENDDCKYCRGTGVLRESLSEAWECENCRGTGKEYKEERTNEQSSDGILSRGNNRSSERR